MYIYIYMYSKLAYCIELTYNFKIIRVIWMYYVIRVTSSQYKLDILLHV